MSLSTCLGSAVITVELLVKPLSFLFLWNLHPGVIVTG